MFLIILLLFVSCTNRIFVSQIPEQEKLYGIPFEKYSDNGFLFTPENYKDEYSSRGIIEYELYPQYNADVKKNSDGSRYLIESQVELKIADVLDSLYSIAKRMKADAVINLKFDIVYRSLTDIDSRLLTINDFNNPSSKAFIETGGDYILKNKDLKIQGVKISGFAIKRKLP